MTLKYKVTDVKFPEQGRALNGHWEQVRITHANNTLSAYCNVRSFICLTFQSLVYSYPQATLNQVQPPPSISTMSPGVKALFLVSGSNLPGLWLWPFAPQFPAHTGMTHGWFSKMGWVLFYLRFHPDSRSATGTGWLPTKASVCLALTGEFKAGA